MTRSCPNCGEPADGITRPEANNTLSYLYCCWIGTSSDSSLGGYMVVHQ